MSKLTKALLTDTLDGVNEEARDVLREFYNHYCAAYDFRERYYRCKKFVAGDQWSDMTTFKGREMTEKEMLDMQGRYAVVNNFLKILIRNYKGTYIKQDLEPVCRARKSSNQPIADALSTALQYVWDINSQKELLAATFEEGLIAPLFVEKVSIGFMNGKYDVWTEPVEVTRFIPDSNMRDPRSFDCEIVGEIHDMTKSKLLSTFAKSKEDRRRISKIYDSCSDRRGVLRNFKTFGKIDTDNAFLFPDFGMCRVYEIWTKEHRDGYICHDFINGDYYSVGQEDYEAIKSENAKRVEQSRSAGVSEYEIQTALSIVEGKKGFENEEMPRSCRLIKTQYFYEDYWYFRFMAPNGEVISEGESPYKHKSHPYVFRFYPLIGGNVQSFIEDVIDLQKDVNRMDAMYDWIVRHSAKGALLFPRDQMDKEHGWDEQMYARAWASPDAFIPYNPKAGYSIPQQISKNNTDIGITEHITRKTQWMQDITGVQGSLQGKTGYAGTSGSLYAQQTENATTSLLDLLNIFSAFVSELSGKQVSCMQQIYDENKFREIADLYDKDFATLAGIRDADIIIRVAESASSPVYRESAHQELHLLFQLGIIDAETMLKNDPSPYSYKLLRDKREADMALIAAGGQPLPNSVPQQASQAAIAGANAPQAGANNIYNNMAKKQ